MTPNKIKALLAAAAVFVLVGIVPNVLLAAAGAGTVSSLPITGTVMALFVGMGVMNLGGNKAAPLADAATRAQALSLHPPAGMTRVVVVREGFMGKANGVDLNLDGRDVAQLKSPRLTVLHLTPGTHTLRAALAGAMNTGSVPAVASFEVQAGQTLVFQLRLAIKLSTSDVVLERVDAPDAVLPRLARMKMVLASA